jgi:hypothetical protein
MCDFSQTEKAALTKKLQKRVQDLQTAIQILSGGGARTATKRKRKRTATRKKR